MYKSYAWFNVFILRQYLLNDVMPPEKCVLLQSITFICNIKNIKRNLTQNHNTVTKLKLIIRIHKLYTAVVNIIILLLNKIPKSNLVPDL